MVVVVEMGLAVVEEVLVDVVVVKVVVAVVV